ncbi:MAG: Mu transposase C-terminal domain-containing protein [Arsenophonus sp. NC-PG7-MAG3]
MRDLFIPQIELSITRCKIRFFNNFYYATNGKLIWLKISNEYYIHDDSKIIMPWMNVIYLC